MEEYGSHIWIRDVENFGEDLKNVPEDRIELVNVGETKIEYIVGETKITIALIDGNLKVVTKALIK